MTVDPTPSFTSAVDEMRPTGPDTLDAAELAMAAQLVQAALDDAGTAFEGIDCADTGLWVARRRLREDGRSGDLLAPALARLFDIRGPVVDVDTECASALSAVAAAWSALRSDLCRAAVVVAVRAASTAKEIEQIRRMGHLSPTNRCLSFDCAADGYVLAEGGGAVVLTRGDISADFRSYGRVIGVHIAHIGASPVSFAMALEPMADTLARFARRVGIEGRIGYVEAHAVGSRIGDELEVLALQRGLPGSLPIQIGAVKRLIGHLEAASGMAALQKVLLAAKHGVLPPTGMPSEIVPHFRDPTSRTALMTKPGGWNPHADVALVNAVGQSGVMAFIAIERPPVSASMCGQAKNGLREVADNPATLVALIQSILVEFLPGFNETTSNQSFFEMGLDSTSAIRMARRIEERLGIPVSPTLFFDKHSFEPLFTELHAQVLLSSNLAITGVEADSLANRVRKLEALLLEEPSQSARDRGK
jgi:acyl transferase domain-containing protein